MESCVSYDDNLTVHHAAYSFSIPGCGHSFCIRSGLDERRYAYYNVSIFCGHETDLKLSLDHEIFQIRDEILAKEGANVTFYGTKYQLAYHSIHTDME